MGRNNSDRHAELAPQGAPKLTRKQQHFTDLLIAGVGDSDAYRESYDTLNMAPNTIHREAHALARHPKITTALAADRAAATHGLNVHAKDLVVKLQEIADAPVKLPVTASDKIAAIREIGRLAGLYSGQGPEGATRPVNITKVTMILDRGGTTETITESVPRVVDGAGRVLDPSEEESI